MKKNTFFAKQNKAVQGILLVIALWMLWFVGSAISGQIRDIFVQSQEVHFVTMEKTEHGYGLLTATEHLVIAEADGAVEPLIAEGERVRKGNAIFRIGDLYQYTNHAGRVSYQIDGMESGMDIQTVSALDLKAEYNEQQRRKAKQADAVSGEPYAKVQETMRDVALYVTMPNSDYIASLEVGQRITLELTEYGSDVKGTIEEIRTMESKERCFKVAVSTMPATLFQQRIYQVTLPHDSERVLTIPKQALAKKRGVDGIYYLHKGFVFWKEITVSDRWIQQGVLVVESGLEEGDIIVTTPRLVREGENIKF